MNPLLSRPTTLLLTNQFSMVVFAAVAVALDGDQAAALLDEMGFINGQECVVDRPAVAARGTRDWMLKAFLHHVLERDVDISRPFTLPEFYEFQVRASEKGMRFAGRRGEPPWLITATAILPHVRADWPDLLAGVRAEWRNTPKTIH